MSHPIKSVVPERRSTAARLLLVALLAALSAIAVPAGVGSADPHTQGGWTTNGSVAVGSTTVTVVPRGATATIQVTVRSAAAATALVDIEVSNSLGNVHQRFWDQQAFTAGQTRTFSTQWAVPANARLERHTVRVGIFGPGWTGLRHWNNRGGSVRRRGRVNHHDHDEHDHDDDRPVHNDDHPTANHHHHDRPVDNDDHPAAPPPPPPPRPPRHPGGASPPCPSAPRCPPRRSAPAGSARPRRSGPRTPRSTAPAAPPRTPTTPA